MNLFLSINHSLIIKSKFMKQFVISFSNRAIFRILLCFVLLCSSFTACNKPDHFPFPGNNEASKYPSDVIDKWLTMQIRLYKDATGIPNVAFARYYAYSGVAALEALAPGSFLSASTTFSSLPAIAEDAGNSRLYGGIHYQPSIDTGLIQGRKVTANILRSLGLGVDH